MPAAIAVLGAVGSVSAGLAAGGVLGGIMVAGGALTGLGLITGNRKLQKFGGLLGLAGGVAGLASGAWSSAASGVANDAASAGFGGAEYGMAENLAGRAGNVAGAAGGLADSASGMLQSSLGTSDIGVGAANAGGLQPPAGIGATPTAPTTVNIVNGGGTQGTAGGLQGTWDGRKQRVSDVMPSSGGGVGGQGGGMLNSSMQWMEKNPRLTQAGAGLMAAGLTAYGQSEALKDQMRLQEEAQARARKRLSDSVQGVDVPVYQRRGG